MRFRRWNWAILLASLAMGGSLHAQSGLSPQVEAQLLLRVLAYDRSLDQRPGDNVVVAILYDATNGTSNRARAGIVRAFRATPIQMIGSKNLKFLEVNVADANLVGTLRQESVVAAYITDGLENRLPALLDAAQSAHVTTLSGNMRYAWRGVAAAVDTVAGRPQIYVNLSSARASGADFPATLLKLATVIK